MLQYAARRVLWMFPTFFLISLIVFALINLAPGDPGAASGGANNAQQASSSTSASVAAWRLTNGLARPVVLNTRPWWSTDTVRGWVVTADALEGTPTPRDRIAARETLTDGGIYLVPHLVALLDDPDAQVRSAALSWLPVAARLPFERDPRNDPAIAEVNRGIDAFNQTFREWRCATPEEACVAAASTQWKTWWGENRARYERTGMAAVEALFLDTRFALYWTRILTLDCGNSYLNGEPICPVVAEKMKYSVSLSLTSVLLAYLIAVPLGVYSAVRSGSRSDTIVTVLLFVLYSLPTFFTGTVLLQLFSQGTPFEWFPRGDFQSRYPPGTTLGQLGDIAWHLALPVATSTSVALAALSRYARAGVIDVIRADYIRTARAKGLEEAVVIIKHAVRNGMIPILTLLGGILPVLVSGNVVVEVVFNIPGMGQYLFESIGTRDYNAVMAVLLASAVLTLLGILLSDLSYALADPRISLD